MSFVNGCNLVIFTSCMKSTLGFVYSLESLGTMALLDPLHANHGLVVKILHLEV